MLVFKREWKRNQRSLFVWSISIALIIILVMSVYQGFAENQNQLQELLKSYPEGFMTAFGMDRLDITNVLGFYAMEGYLMLTLFGSMYAMLLSSSIISKEESEKTIEFLLAKPITRNKILANKIGLAIFNILLFNLFNGIVTFISFEIFKLSDYDFGTFILLILGPFLLHLTFAAIGFLISIFITKAKTIYPVSIGIVLFAYFLSIIAGISEKLKFFKHLTPFYYVDAANIIDQGINGVYLLIMLFIMIVGIGLAYVLYNKKDITV